MRPPRWPFGNRCAPHWAGASTKHPVSMARARRSVSQCAAPVTGVKAAGTVRISAPAFAERPVKLRKADVVADRQPDGVPRSGATTARVPAR
jgi:hypothetical protein